MIHTFDSDIAAKYGVNAAILLQNIYYWIEKNKANDKHFYDGHYWTYNSVKAFEEMFPYMSKNQINSVLQKLESDGVIISGNYNSSTYDRTKWYAITERGFSLIENQKCIYQKSEMDCSENGNGFTENQKPIPDNKPDNKPDNTTVSNDTVCHTDVQRCIDAWNSLSDCGIKPVQRIHSGTKRYDSLVARIREYGVDEVLSAIEKIRHSKFLQGKSGGKRQWVIKFDWFVLPNNFPKVLEGNYDDNDVQLVCDNSPNENSNGIWGGMRQ